MSTDDEVSADISAPTAPRMILGNQLHRYREAAGISPDRAGYEIRASRSKISRMENGRGWFKEYLGLEAAASVIRAFELQFVHGLFQTEAYARAVTLLGNTSASAEEIDRRVGLRLKRQDLLT